MTSITQAVLQGDVLEGTKGGHLHPQPSWLSPSLSSCPFPSCPLPSRGSSLLSPSSRFNHFVPAACPCLHSPIPPPRPAPSPRLPPPLPPLSIYFQLSRRFTLRFGSAASDLGCLPPLCAPALGSINLGCLPFSSPSWCQRPGDAVALPAPGGLGAVFGAPTSPENPPALKRSSTHPVNAADPGAAQQKQQCARGIALPHPLAVSLREQLWVWGCRSSALKH